MAHSWPAGGRERLSIDGASGAPGGRGGYDGLARSGEQLYRPQAIVLDIDGSVAGRLYVGTLLDDRYARELARVAGADVVRLDDAHVVATTMAGAARRALMDGCACPVAPPAWATSARSRSPTGASAIWATFGKTLSLDDGQLEILRLGALLHANHSRRHRFFAPDSRWRVLRRGTWTVIR